MYAIGRLLHLRYIEKEPRLLATIKNPYPTMTTVIAITHPFEKLCPMSGEPQVGSTVSIRYIARETLLETKSVRAFLASFINENPYAIRDLEEAVQFIARTCSEAIYADVTVEAHYILASSVMDVTATSRYPYAY